MLAIRSFLHSLGVVPSEQNAKKLIAIALTTTLLLVFYYVCLMFPQTSPLLSTYYSSRRKSGEHKRGDVLTDIVPTDIKLKDVSAAIIVTQVPSMNSIVL